MTLTTSNPSEAVLVTGIGTVMPTWTNGKARVLGHDEDVVTLAVAAARQALDSVGDDERSVNRVVLVSRDLPLLEGGNGAALLAGIGLSDDVPVVEQVGGAPAVMDAITSATPGTLVIAADLEPAGAGALLVGRSGVALRSVGRIVRSLPVRARSADGQVREYDDPRLLWERGARVSIDKLDLTDKPVVVAGLSAKQAGTLCMGTPPALPVLGASSAIFALAALGQVGGGGMVLALEQASVSAVHVAGVIPVSRLEPEAVALPRTTLTPGPDISISLAAYERAFEPKVRWEAGQCDACGTLALPPRLRCLECGSEAGWSLTPLPRRGAVYTGVTINVPVPGVRTPYSLVIVELDDVPVRALVQVTGVPAGSTPIGTRGTLVLRRVALRSGVPDYGYAFLPDTTESHEELA